MNNLANRPQCKNFSARVKYINERNTQNRIEKYNQNPKLCKECNLPIPYKKRRNIFCSKPCSATFNNIGRVQSDATRKKISEKMWKGSKKYNSGEMIGKLTYLLVWFNKCECCNILFTASRKNTKYCHTCRTKNKPMYKKMCAFSISPKEFPHLFNIPLIKKYGWYVPASQSNHNINGVTWDHLYPIHLGFKNNIDPSIISHPANAELVPHRENLHRYNHQKYMITYEKLLERIALWDSGCRNLTTYYK